MTTIEAKYKIVDNSLRETLRSTKQTEDSPLIQLLREGKTVFIEEKDGSKLNTMYDGARRRGYKFHARKVEYEKKLGHLGWFEKVKETTTNGS